jgi:hypothetical protein
MWCVVQSMFYSLKSCVLYKVLLTQIMCVVQSKFYTLTTRTWERFLNYSLVEVTPVRTTQNQAWTHKEHTLIDSNLDTSSTLLISSWTHSLIRASTHATNHVLINIECVWHRKWMRIRMSARVDTEQIEIYQSWLIHTTQ